MELNREQIIKALECCSKPAFCGAECPYYEDGSCIRRVTGNALSLINELTEENERLRAERDVRDITIKDLYFRNKELQKANEDLGKHCTELTTELIQYTESKADTLSELKNRLAREVGTYLSSSIIKVKDMFKLVDQIAEEMLEGV